MQLILISGLSGSGKSIALNVLEDVGLYCVDNLPVTLLPQLVVQLRGEGVKRIAVAVDVRSGASIEALPDVVDHLRDLVDDLRFIFLDARDETLLARFSETRRRHPLADQSMTVQEAIDREREMLAPIAALGQRMDTSQLHPNALRAWVRARASRTLRVSTYNLFRQLPVNWPGSRLAGGLATCGELKVGST